MAAMQHDEAAREALALEVAQLALFRVEGMRVDAARTQRLEHARARHDGDLAFGRTAAKKDDDLAEALGIHDAHSALPSRVKRSDFEGTAPPSSTTFAGTAPIEPAPMQITTSPSRALSRIARGIAAISSTKTGSTLPATRRARARERPSAATIGASPAA